VCVLEQKLAPMMHRETGLQKGVVPLSRQLISGAPPGSGLNGVCAARRVVILLCAATMARGIEFFGGRLGPFLAV
jgi:hypothetical protein